MWPHAAGDSALNDDRLRVGVDLVPVAEIESSMARYGARISGGCSPSRRALTRRARRRPRVGGSVWREGSHAEGPRAQRRCTWLAGHRGAAAAGGPLPARASRSGPTPGRRGGTGPAGASMTHEGPMAAAVVIATQGGIWTQPPTAAACVIDIRSTNSGAIRMDETIRSVLGSEGKLYGDAATIGEDVDLFQEGLTSHACVNVMLALEDAYDLEFPDHMLRKKPSSPSGPFVMLSSKSRPMKPDDRPVAAFSPSVATAVVATNVPPGRERVSTVTSDSGPFVWRPPRIGSTVPGNSEPQRR